MIERELLHRGVIKSINNRTLVVEINAMEACMNCNEREACSLAPMKVKEIEVNGYEGTFHAGQHVNVVVSTSQGFRALFFCYLFPLFFVLTVMGIFTCFTENDGITGLASLLVLIPYYLILYRFRNRIKRTAEFKIEPVIT